MSDEREGTIGGSVPAVTPPPGVFCEVHPASKHHPPPSPHAWQQHHPVVRAWQGLWQPPMPWPNHGVYQGQLLWDARVIWVPATCHLNVHDLLVELMHELAAGKGFTGPPQLADLDNAMARVAGRLHIRHASADYAELVSAGVSPARFINAGGDLRVLIEAGAWGEA